MTITYKPTSEDPPLGIPWADNTGECIDFSGHTFTLLLINQRTRATALNKTDGITGYDAWQPDDTTTWSAGSYNILAIWEEGELADLADGLYEVDLVAVDGAGRERPYEGPRILIRIKT